ncbi:MAG: peptidase [Elusimicrobia bacterium RIFOXYA12_FULL_51_18]|nr:MAG: peptidase [Elusimicrobia bacterium RIFOXYA12_FULL_51_18]OGS30007.1 MAG: peptidase [Elusimicrobia bacterium RIFOXYA2_FULL_53_38]
MKAVNLAALVLLAVPACLVAREIPMRDFFRDPEKTSYSISPDGKYISFMAPYKNRLNIFVRERVGGEAVLVSSETERPITGGYFWKGNDRIIYMKDFKGDENFHIVSVDRTGTDLKDLTPYPGVRARIIDDLPDNDLEMIIGMNRRNKEIFDVFRLNVKTGELSLAAENPGNITGWLTDHYGRLRAAVTTDGTEHTLLYREDEKGEFKPVIATSFKESFDPMFFTFDNKRLYALSNLGRDKAAVVEFDPALKKETAVLYEHPEVDVSSLFYSRKRKVLISARYATWKSFRKFFDPEFEAMVQDLEKQLPGYEVGIQENDKAENLYIVRTYSDRTLGTYYLYDWPAKKLEKLAEVSPWLDEKEMAEMKPVSYKSRDGLIINGYLTVPKGVEAKNLPLVVNPHGGPWVRDSWGFNPEVQFLANRGYAVLQMNYRGSTGYGRKFWEASFKQWGLKMQDDITDGVNYLINERIADPKRVAIYGGSYGGYATLAGAAFTPGLYACAVDYVGVSNLLTFMKTIPPYWKPMLDQMHEMVGDPATEEEKMKAVSPAFHAARIKAPLFVAQGAKDPRVNINESNQIVENLRKRGVAVEYMVKDNEGHGFHNEENRFDFYEAMEKFLSRHLKAKPEKRP